VSAGRYLIDHSMEQRGPSSGPVDTIIVKVRRANDLNSAHETCVNTDSF